MKLPPTETQGQIEWFTHLKEAIETGQTQDALDAIEGAIKMLEREKNDANEREEFFRRG